MMSPIQIQASVPTLGEALTATALLYPERTAFTFLHGEVDSENSISFGELHRQARLLAAHLASLGPPGTTALLLHQPGLEYITALLACIHAGWVAVPAYPPRANRPLDRLHLLARDARARFAMITRSVHQRIAERLGEYPELSQVTWITPDAAQSGNDAHLTPPDLGSDDLAILQYTSGSTGNPKGVELSHGNLLHNISLIRNHLALTPEDRAVSWLPPYHDMGLIGTILVPLLVGTEVTLMAPSAFLQRPSNWLEAIAACRATVSGGPDFSYQLCTQRISPEEREKLDLSSWRVAFTGAERVRHSTLRQFSEAFAVAGFRPEAFTTCYGLAEGTLAVSFAPVQEPARSASFDEIALGAGRAQPAASPERGRVLVSCGPPLPDWDLVIVDPEQRQPLPEGRVGEILISGPSVAGGYFGQQELSEETFGARVAVSSDKRYLATGDVGFLQNGELFVTGRIKDLIIILGVNHYPEDIETTVEEAHPALRPGASVAFSVEDGRVEQLVIVAELKRVGAAPSDEVAERVRTSVAAAHDIPVFDVVLVPPATLPKTSSGKRQRRLCRKLYLDQQLTVVASVKRGEAQEQKQEAPRKLILEVAQIMAEVLHVPSVDPDADFFALGGHSLMATQLASRLEAEFEVDVPVAVVFEAATAARLANALTARVRRARPAIARVDRSGPLPLSYSQERMWFLHQLDPAGAAYNVAAGLQIEGALNRDALQRALALLIARHEILRTRYLTEDGKPRAVIDHAVELDLPYIDLTRHDDPLAEAEAQGSVIAGLPFDLERGPVFRFALFRLDQARHAMVASVHHIATDGWSMTRMLDEVLADYGALCADREPNVSPPELQYVDYAAWQRQWIEGERFESELAYWKQKLAGARTGTLPTDRPFSDNRSAGGSFEPMELPAPLLNGVRRVAHQQAATPFMVMLAAFQVLLYRYTHEHDCMIGVPIANRNQRLSEGLLGTLVNTLALRLSLAPNLSFRELLRETRATCLEAYTHQNLPFERLVTAVDAKRQEGMSPLVELMFDYQNAPMAGEWQGLKFSPLMIARGASQFALSLLVLDSPLAHVATIEYRTALFDRCTIQRLLRHYRAILEAIVTDPGVALQSIELLSEAEQSEIVQTGTTPPRKDRSPAGLVERFVQQVERHPDKLAVRDGTSELSYRELYAEVHALAAQLHQRGVGPESRVAVCLHRTRYVPIALLAILWTGASYLPVDPRYPEARVQFILADAQPTLTLVDDDETVVPGTALNVTTLGAPDVACPPVVHDPALAAYQIYTSGSTGRPKGVVIEHAALLNFLDSMAHEPGIRASDHLLSVTTISFDIAGLELFLPLIFGASLTLATDQDAMDPRRLSRLIEETGTTLLQATPTTWRMLIESGWQGRQELTMLCGGEALLPGLARELLPRGRALYNMYGPTETTIWSSMARITEGERINIGRPIDATSVYILDAGQRLVPFGVTGEICIGGAGVARGYFARPELTAKRFLHDPYARQPGARMYRTGDRGLLRADGQLECLGRMDYQVKIRGHRIELAEIDSALEAQPGVKQGVAAAHQIGEGNTHLVAYCILEEPAPTALDILDGLRRMLPEVMVPSTLVQVESFPLTDNGKVDRKALPLPSELGVSKPRERVAPGTPTEQRLAKIWADVLQVPDPGVLDDFFDVGNSLLAVQLFARMEREFGVALPLASLFEGPTIRALAQRLESGGALPGDHGARFEYLVRVRSGGTHTPIFCVHGAGGNVLNLAPLVEHLDAEHPFYGLQARGLDGLKQPFESVEEAASAYLEEIRKVQPEGPYVLSGYCGGGVIAFEMARQLMDRGERVDSLLLIDTYRPGVELDTLTLADRLAAVKAGGPAYIFARGRARLQRSLAGRAHKAQVAHHQRAGKPLPYELREQWLMDRFFAIATSYRTTPLAVSALLLRAQEVPKVLRCKEPDLGWRGYLNKLKVIEIPGDHHSMATEPHVRRLADAWNARLRRLRARSGIRRRAG